MSEPIWSGPVTWPHPFADINHTRPARIYADGRLEMDFEDGYGFGPISIHELDSSTIAIAAYRAAVVALGINVKVLRGLFQCTRGETALFDMSTLAPEEEE